MAIDIVIPNQVPLNLNANAGGINRQTVNKNFAGKLREAARASTLQAQKATNFVAPYVPGAAVLSASLGAAASNLSDDPLLPRGRLVTELSTQPGAGGGDLIGAMEEMQENMMSTNLQMLGWQRKFQQESENYTLASNMMKTKHDTSKNAINNIR